MIEIKLQIVKKLYHYYYNHLIFFPKKKEKKNVFTGKPESLYNCTLSNQTTDSLSVECCVGFDGGQPQHFLLEVFDRHTGILQANITSKENAAFTVHGLGSGRILNMVLYAVNAKGRSEPTLLEGFTLKIAEKQTGK